jgi:hypothetical protein
MIHRTVTAQAFPGGKEREFGPDFRLYSGTGKCSGKTIGDLRRNLQDAPGTRQTAPLRFSLAVGKEIIANSPKGLLGKATGYTINRGWLAWRLRFATFSKSNLSLTQYYLFCLSDLCVFRLQIVHATRF